MGGGLLRKVCDVWVSRIQESTGKREGVLMGMQTMAAPYRDTWVGEVVQWMGKMGIGIEGVGEIAGWGGGDEGMVVGWWAYPCAVAGLLVDAIDSTTLSTQLMGWGSSSRRGVRGGGSG